jgi:competence protein ComEC
MNQSAIAVRALLYGEIRDLDPEIFYLLSRLGLGHMLSVSGFHMAIAVGLGAVTYWIIARIWQPQSIRAHIISQTMLLLVTLAWMLFLAQASGWAKPAVRSLAFVAVGLGARAMGLSLSRLFIVLVSLLVAWILGQGSILSFLLSATAVGGFMLAKESNLISFLLWPWLATNVLVTILFHQLSLVAPLANTLFAPVINVGIVLPAFLSHVFGLQRFFDPIARNVWELILPLLKKLAQNTFAALWVPRNDCLIVFAMLAALWFLSGRLNFKKRKTIILIASLLYCLSPTRLNGAKILDVQQGDSILLENFLVDVGAGAQRGPYPALATTAIENLGIDHLEGILITHSDWDHYGGLKTLLARHNVNKIYISEESMRFNKTLEIIQWAERAQVPIVLARGLITPYSGLSCKTAPKFLNSTNDQSILCRYELTNGQKLLLTGDMGAKAEKCWLQDPQFIRADFLKVAHHGSKSNSSQEFLNAVQASTAIISSGKQNRYRHPHKELLDRLTNINVLRTDQEGEISLP